MSEETKVVIPSEEEVAKYGSGSTGQTCATEPGGDAEAGPTDAARETAQPAPEQDWKDIALRARAELSNYQKRAEKDRAEALRYAHAALVKALLPVLDNLERVVQSGSADAPPGGQVEPNDLHRALLDGAKLTLDTFLKVLRDFDVEVISAEGQPFDPQVHEAMMERPSDHAERIVLQELAKGYRLHDRVLRPAKVIVSKPSAQG
ncbi:MAG: nucleotide exchange factor GrpE [Phycisphaerae bacterium]|jgi:molecular chaperone GrpE